MMQRRQFISTIAIASASIPLASSLVSDSKSNGRISVRFFSKPLDGYDADFMCDCIAGAGIGGIDLTVRNGGRVEPSEIESALPRFIENADKYSLVTDMMVTGIVSASDPMTERVLKTASLSGIKYYRFGWMDYDLKSGVAESLRKKRSAIAELAVLNRKYNLKGGYQNHAGAMVGSAVWDLQELLKDLPSESAGIQYDVRHAMVEGANSWIIGMHLIAGQITSLAIKDFTWRTVDGKPQAVSVPLGEGMVDWDLFFRTLKELNIVCPVTLHVEYPLFENGEENLSLILKKQIIVRKLKKDADFLGSYIKKYISY